MTVTKEQLGVSRLRAVKGRIEIEQRNKKERNTITDSPGDVEGLPTAMSVASHAGSRGSFAFPALLLADITSLQQTNKGTIAGTVCKYA